MKIFGPGIYNKGTSGGGGGDTTIVYNEVQENQIILETRVSGNQGKNLPANIVILSIVAFAPEAKAGVSMSIVGAANGLLIDAVDFLANDIKPFAPNAYIHLESEIVTSNTTVIDADPNKKFKFIISYKTLFQFNV